MGGGDIGRRKGRWEEGDERERGEGKGEIEIERKEGEKMGD